MIKIKKNEPYLVRVALTVKLTNQWPSFPDRIGIWGVGFCGGRSTRRKTLGARARTNNKLGPHVTPGPGIEPGPQRWEASDLTTAPYLHPHDFQEQYQVHGWCGILLTAYSCFEKGCPTKLYATMPKGIMGNGSLWYLIEALGVSTT